MDVPTSSRPNAANPPGPSSSASSASSVSCSGPAGRAPGAGATAAVPFASLLAAARGKLGAAMLGRAGAARTGARAGALRGGGASAAKMEGGCIESAVHGKKRGEGDPRDAGDDDDLESDGDGDGEGDATRGGRKAERAEVDWLDPSARQAAQLAPPGLAPASAPSFNAANANEPLRARSLEELLPALVRRIAWAGDRNKGTVQLELGAGVYAGTTVTVHADGGRVRVEIGGSEGPELDRLRARLDARLRGHGLDVESVT